MSTITSKTDEITQQVAGFLGFSENGTHQYYHVGCALLSGIDGKLLQTIPKWPKGRRCSYCDHAGEHRPPYGSTRWLWRAERWVIMFIHAIFKVLGS